MTPANSTPTPLTVLTGLALLGPLGVLAWQTPRSAPAPEESVTEAFATPLPPIPAAPPAAGSSLLVAKVKDPAVQPEHLTDAPHDELAGTLTGTLAEIEAKLSQEKAPRLERFVRPRKARAATRGLPGCISQCRVERRQLG